MMDTIYEITDNSVADDNKKKKEENIVINSNIKSTNFSNKNFTKYFDKNNLKKVKDYHRHVPKNNEYLWTIIKGDIFRNQMMYCNARK